MVHEHLPTKTHQHSYQREEVQLYKFIAPSLLMKHIFIIEHLESQLWPWCLIEYKHISKIVGKNNLWFTNIQKKDIKELEQYGKVSKESIKTLKIKNACILDPESPHELTPLHAKTINYFIFGGILGDHPPKKRTEEELTSHMHLQAFNIGKEQMSTDNAVYVVHTIFQGALLKDIPFQDKVEIKINNIESTILPYRYALVNNKPFMSPTLIKYLKRDNKHP